MVSDLTTEIQATTTTHRTFLSRLALGSQTQVYTNRLGDILDLIDSLLDLSR